jgi:hypothetical protein
MTNIRRGAWQAPVKCVKPGGGQTRFATVLLIALVLIFASCAAKPADISAYADTPIEIAGLTDKDFSVTPRELSELDCVKRSATGATAKAGTVSASGPLLDTFLAQYGKKMTDFERIRFIGADDYRKVLKGDYLTDYEVVLSIASGNKPLPATDQPLRILIPEAESEYWVYSCVRIEFVYP